MPRVVRQLLIAIIAGTSLNSCRGGTDSLEPVPPYVTLVTNGSSFQAGSLVPVIIVNHSTFVLGYGPCTNMLLDMLTVAGWREVPMLRNCTEEERLVQPGSQATAQMPLPADAIAATYRVRFKFIHVIMQNAPDDGLVPRAQLMTNAFAIR